MIIKLLTAPPSEQQITSLEQRFRQELAKRVSKPKLSEYLTDPIDPLAGDTWILNTAGTYRLSYKTEAGTIVRTILT